MTPEVNIVTFIDSAIPSTAGLNIKPVEKQKDTIKREEYIKISKFVMKIFWFKSNNIWMKFLFESDNS